MARKKTKEDTFDEIYSLLESRLNAIGDIRANDAWEICRFKTSKGYATITSIFRQIMQIMIEQGKAIKTDRYGIYRIIKSNNKTI